jgi:hypothetical protein
VYLTLVSLLCSLSDDKAKTGCTTSNYKHVEQAFSLSNLGAQVSHCTFQPPQIFRLLSILRTPLGRYGGGGYVALLLLQKLHCQPNRGYPSSLPPFSSFWVEVENSSKPVAPNDISTPYDLLPWSR